MHKIILSSFVLVLSGLISGNNEVTSSNLRQLHIMFRHGQRAPTETYKNDPYINMTWSGGWGQLTNRGKFQMYRLGLRLKEIYGEFIPKYYFADEVKMWSSYADRCLMSAETLLAALFPPKDDQIWNENLPWQPIPVHYLPRNQDTLIAMKAPCKKYDEEFVKVLNSEPIRSLNDENEELYRYLTLHTGQPVDNIGSVELLYNTLEIELLHNLTLPSWTQNVSLSRMRELAARYMEVFTETDFMKRMKGGVFLKHVISSMKTKENFPFLHLYAGHDITLVNILKTLGYKSLLKPGLGASLIFELRNDTKVSIFYRDDVESDPERIVVANCKPSCYLDNLETALKTLLPTNLTQECNN